MQKIIKTSAVLLGIIFLAGCGKQQVSQTPSTSGLAVQKPAQPKTNQPNANTGSPEEMERNRNRANDALVRSLMTYVVEGAKTCAKNKKQIISGNGGDKICEGEDLSWPTIGACGSNAYDAKWVVKNGADLNWDITVNCKNFTACNGPQNAICNTDGCKFLGSC
ncbi:MAG: hypothetical protein WCO05_01960 [Candidatus Moraniibacteriota bacterium]|jgi:hypothetical protein